MRWNSVYNRIKDIKKPIGAEIGVYRGEFSENILALHDGLFLYMIDAWSMSTYDGVASDAVSDRFKKIYTEGSFENFTAANERTKKYQDRAYIIPGRSLDIAVLLTEPALDFVFIDAAHDEQSVMADILAWYPKIKRGGWLCGHDYGVPDFPGVKRAVDLFVKENNLILEIDDDFTWFVRVK